MTLIDISTLLFSGIFTILFFWVIGRILLLFFEINGLSSVQIVIVSIVAGCIATTIGYSLLESSKFKTISSAMVVITGVWLVIRGKWNSKQTLQPKNRMNKKAELKALAVLILFYAVIFFTQLIRMDIIDTRNVPLGSYDAPFYITVSEQLNLRGIENSLSYLNGIHGISIASPQPYHFFDLWLNAFLERVTPGNHIFVYLFLFIPCLAFFGFLMMVYIGIYSLEFFGDTTIKTKPEALRWRVLIVAFPFLFLIGCLPYSNIGHNGLEFLKAPLVINYKLYYSYFLLGLGIPLFLKRSYLNLAFVLLLCCYFFILYVPLAITVMLLVWIVEIKKSGVRNFHRELVSPSLLFVFGIACIGLFYYLQPGEKQLAEVTRVNYVEVLGAIVHNFFSVGAIYTFVRAYAAKVFYFIPFLALIFVVLWSKESRSRVGQVILFPFVLILIGGFWSFVFGFHAEGFQFLDQTYSPGMYFIFFITILWLLAKPKSMVSTSILLLAGIQLIFSTWKTLDLDAAYEFKTSVDFKNKIEKNSNRFSPLGLNVVVITSVDKSSRALMPYLNFYTDFLKFLPNTTLLQAAMVEPAEVDKASKEVRDVYLRSPFVQFANSHQVPFTTAVRMFMQENRISFFVWKKGNIDETVFADIIDDTINDPESGYCISFVHFK